MGRRRVIAYRARAGDAAWLAGSGAVARRRARVVPYGARGGRRRALAVHGIATELSGRRRPPIGPRSCHNLTTRARARDPAQWEWAGATLRLPPRCPRAAARCPEPCRRLGRRQESRRAGQRHAQQKHDQQSKPCRAGRAGRAGGGGASRALAPAGTALRCCRDPGEGRHLLSPVDSLGPPDGLASHSWPACTRLAGRPPHYLRHRAHARPPFALAHGNKHGGARPLAQSAQDARAGFRLQAARRLREPAVPPAA